MKALIIVIIATLLAPTVAYPEWAAYDCSVAAWIHVVWADPPPNVTPFDTSNRGWLFVNAGSHTYSYRWDYYWYEDYQGHSFFNWATYYEMPSEPYYLIGWVHSTNGGDYWIVPDRFYPDCSPNRLYNTFIPLVIR